MFDGGGGAVSGVDTKVAAAKATAASKKVVTFGVSAAERPR